MPSSALKDSPSKLLKNLLQTPEVVYSFRLFEEQADAITEEQIKICSIPSIPFGEEERAEYFRQKFLDIGLSNVHIDAAGNCLGMLQGRFQSPLMVVSAHLDTVFSSNTDFTVRRCGERLCAPGISDDGCGLVALVTIASALMKSRAQTSAPFCL
jgi:acetylornithine deacetylase/succinyl-diaminopimelate desuccinylase-like protein